jgi:hypothetical protein
MSRRRLDGNIAILGSTVESTVLASFVFIGSCQDVNCLMIEITGQLRSYLLKSFNLLDNRTRDHGLNLGGICIEESRAQK